MNSNFNNEAVDVQGLAANNETTETSTMSNVQVIKRDNFEKLVNSICDDMKSDIIGCIRFNDFANLTALDFPTAPLEMLESLTKMVRNLQDEDEIDLIELGEEYPDEFDLITNYLFWEDGELTSYGERMFGNINDVDDYNTIYEFFRIQ